MDPMATSLWLMWNKTVGIILTLGIEAARLLLGMTLCSCLFANEVGNDYEKLCWNPTSQQVTWNRRVIHVFPPPDVLVQFFLWRLHTFLSLSNGRYYKDLFSKGFHTLLRLNKQTGFKNSILHLKVGNIHLWRETLDVILNILHQCCWSLTY